MNPQDRRIRPTDGRITLHTTVGAEGLALAHGYTDVGRLESIEWGFDGSRSGEMVAAICSPTPSRAEAIQSRLADLEAELADIKRFGDDTYDEGAVLTFKANFGGEKVYSYAAIKAGGWWHLTGAKAPSNLTWDGFVEFMRGANVRKVRMVTNTERVV